MRHAKMGIVGHVDHGKATERYSKSLTFGYKPSLLGEGIGDGFPLSKRAP